MFYPLLYITATTLLMLTSHTTWYHARDQRLLFIDKPWNFAVSTA